MMKKTPLVAALFAACSLPTLAVGADLTAQISSTRPNVVLIVAEDMNPRLGAYGDTQARTPHLDALAKESVVFTQAFTMAGVSAPSRAGLITGAFQNTTGLQHMRTASRPGGGYLGVPPSYVKGYPELLRRHGYFTYNDTKTDYQFTKGHADVGPFSLWTRHGEYNNIDDLHIQLAWRNYDLKNKPFFMNFNPQITHESALFTPENYPAGSEYFVKRWSEFRKQYHYTPTDPNSLKLEPYFQDTPQTRRELAQHYDNIQIMDIQVGKLVDGLKKDGLWDNTIVIFTADNGDGIPRHKREGYDSGTHVPLIVHIPEKYRPAGWGENGSVNSRLISFEDFAPTILGFAGIKQPDYMRGINLAQDFAPQRQFVYGVRGRMDEYDMRSYFIRNHDYQYVRNLANTPGGIGIKFRNALGSMKDLNAANEQHQLSADQQSWFAERPAEELYDLQRDPLQLHNLAAEPAQRQVLATLREEMDRWRNRANDMNLVTEDQMVEDLLDEQGKQRTTLTPVAQWDSVSHKIYLANRTQDASIGYSWDGKEWELYTGSITPMKSASALQFKAIRYGWKESPVGTLSVQP
uniref:sulfatase family protein n=1 Tax=Pectobacterium sp. B1J-3 TaxID=3385371 RepID=UPI0039063BAA